MIVMMINIFDIEFYINNISLLAMWVLALWIYFSHDKLAGAVLFYSFFIDHLYRLVLVYSDQISYTSQGMDAPMWIHVARFLSMIGHLLIPVGLWLLVRGHRKENKRSE